MIKNQTRPTLTSSELVAIFQKHAPYQGAHDHLWCSFCQDAYTGSLPYPCDAVKIGLALLEEQKKSLLLQARLIMLELHLNLTRLSTSQPKQA